MPQTINTNVSSLNAQRNLNTFSRTPSRRRSAIIRFARQFGRTTPPAAIAERMNSQIRGINVAIRNANDGISLAQAAEGALPPSPNVLQRMRELSSRRRCGTNSAAATRHSLDTGIQQLSKEISGSSRHHLQQRPSSARAAGTQTFPGRRQQRRHHDHHHLDGDGDRQHPTAGSVRHQRHHHRGGRDRDATPPRRDQSAANAPPWAAPR